VGVLVVEPGSIART